MGRGEEPSPQPEPGTGSCPLRKWLTPPAGRSPTVPTAGSVRRGGGADDDGGATDDGAAGALRDDASRSGAVPALLRPRLLRHGVRAALAPGVADGLPA